MSGHVGEPGEISSDAELIEELGARAQTGPVVWVGHHPPAGMVGCAEPLDPDADYRAPSACHQQAAAVCVLETDLGREKAWPLVLDECLRLLAPGGLLALRFSNSPLASIFALKHQLAHWPGNPTIRFEYARPDRSMIIGIELGSTLRRTTAFTGVSIGVITNAAHADAVAPLLDSVCELTAVAGIAVETLVCGPSALAAPLASRYPETVFIAEPTALGAHGWITRKKNLLVDRATQPFAVVAHDRYRLRSDFVQALAEYGGDVDLLVPRQERPDGRRFPDWVALGTAWSWSSPGVLPYGDWSPHLYVNGGITAGRTEVLRTLRWNELLFWGQAEDVEMSRRAMARGLIPRFSRHAVAVSGGMRAGTMESFAALPSSADRYFSGGPLNADAMYDAPALPMGREIDLQGVDALAHATNAGLVIDGPWMMADEGIALAGGRFGELAGRLERADTDGLVLRLAFAHGVDALDVIVNDSPLTGFRAHNASRDVWEGVLDATVLSSHVAWRLNIRAPQSVVLRALQLSLVAPEIPRPVLRASVLALAERPRQPWGLSADRLCVADAPLVLRGAERIAVIVDGDADKTPAAHDFLDALRMTVRTNASITVIGPSFRRAGFDTLPVDWTRIGRDDAYRAQSVATFRRLDAQLIVNMQHPRALETELLLMEHRAMLVVGFEAEAFDAAPAEQALVRASYSYLLPESTDTNSALLPFFDLSAATSVTSDNGTRSDARV